MTHLIVCREYPPAPYPPGGIGTYVQHMARLLAEAGETVHLIAQQWEGAAVKTAQYHGGRLIIHRVSLDHALDLGWDRPKPDARLLRGLALSDCPSQLFSWQAAQLAELLIETEGINVIEGQDWEAPLYYLQVRRALGLGPHRRPPCLVHLHSPSHFIFKHNQWDLTLTDYEPLRLLEEYSIRAADGVVCPSRYLAGEAERLFSLSSGSIQVIPYPLGDTCQVERTAETWARESICYAGRLELRKGIVEWVDAAVQVARSHPAVTFEFIGSDTSLTGGRGRSVREYLNERIPGPLRHRFRFQGSRQRSDLLRCLGEVSVAAVPSRWDNLPYTCIEAMSTGLPVLVSSNGGMAELVADGISGWVASGGTAPALEAALKRVLQTAPEQRAAMGEEAARAVHRICSNQRVLEQHLEMRTRLAGAGASRSTQLPANGFNAGPGPVEDRRGTGVVVTCLGDEEPAPGCLDSIRKQARPAEMVVLVLREHHPQAAELAEAATRDHWSVVYESSSSSHAARRVGAETLLSTLPHLRGLVFLSGRTRLSARYLEACESVWERQPGVGILYSWIMYEHPWNELDADPARRATSECEDGDLLDYGAIRTDAWLDAGAGATASDLGDSLARRGWFALTYPDVLRWVSPPARASRRRREKRYSVMTLAQRGSAEISLNWFISAPFAEQVRWIRRGLKQPRRTAQWIAWQARSFASRALVSR